MVMDRGLEPTTTTLKVSCADLYTNPPYTMRQERRQAPLTLLVLAEPRPGGIQGIVRPSFTGSLWSGSHSGSTELAVGIPHSP